ncbi:hypothetical protein C2G38_2156803 [Gigaspora rosea]|uniref:CCHC-type domain-containing protein n=1 Tax=Gigaspora rosea TaxID=44941 RepID=A0A397W3P5_9GLOM|nr:hypothetical protein C2G38_2156803 [Gigaspora rosea]
MPSNMVVSPPSKTIKKFEASLQIIKNRVCKLQQDLVSKKDYINYLEKEISIRNAELDPLRLEISNLIKVRKSNTRAINAENRVVDLQTQLADSQIQLADSQTRLADLQTQLATLQNDYNLLHQAYEAHRKKHNIFKSRELDGRITIQNNLLLANVQLDNKWDKWKNRARNFEQLINNLQAQNLLLQNNPPINPPQIQISNMIGNGPPLFTRKASEDPSDWVLEFKRFVIASRINVIAGAGGVAGRAEAYNLAISCIVGEAKTWYENEIKGRNWQCDNILDSTGVNTLNAIRALNNGGLTALVVRNNAGGDNTITGANIIPVGTWDEDWSIAGGHPAPIGTLSLANYVNAGAGNSIVAPEMTLGQFLYCLEFLYPTVEAQKNLLFFGQIAQGGMSILEYNARISKLGKLAGLPESKMREQYIQELNPMNQYNVRMMAKYYDTRDNITKALVEAEKFLLLQGNFPFSPSGGQVPTPYEKSSNTGLSETEVRNLIKSMIPSTQFTASKPQENQITLSQNNFKKIIAGLKGTIAKGQQTLKKPPGPGKQKANDLAVNHFLDSLTDDTGLPEEDYDHDPIENLRLQLEQLDINQAKIARVILAVLKSSQYKCSKCNKTGHNSRNCSKNKKKSKSRRSNKNRSKKKGKINLATVDLDSESGASSSDHDSNSGSDSEPGSNSSDNESESGGSSSEVESMNVNISKLAPEIPDSDGEDEMLDDPMEIDFIHWKEPTTSLATIPCKIKHLKILALVLDSGAEPPIMSEDIVKRVNWPIDKSKKYDLSSVATVPTESIGIAHNFSITFPLGFTIRKDFVVVRVPKPTLIFPNPLFKKYKCAIDWGKDELKIPFNGKDYIIPVTMHKVKNKLEVNCATTSQDDKPLVSDQILQKVDSNKSDNKPLEELHAPVSFCPDSDNSTLKKTHDL